MLNLIRLFMQERIRIDMKNIDILFNQKQYLS
jgi:hypothetical protein